MTEQAQITGNPRRWTVFIVVAVGVFMSTLDGSIVNIALPTIMADLNAPLATVEWVMMIYLLTVSSLLLIFGRLSDIKGRAWVYSGGLGIFSIGSLLCAIAQTAVWLISARAVQGVGAAMIMSCTQAIIAETFPIIERGRALGLLGAVVASGLTLGPAIGGSILHFMTWQSLFYINVPIGAATMAFASRLVPRPADPAHGKSEAGSPFDWPGALLMCVGTGTFLTAITHGYDWGYGSPAFIGLICLSLGLAAALAFHEARAPHPLLSPSLLRIRLFAYPVLAAMILFMSLFTIIFLMPFFLIYPCGLTVRTAGMVMVTPFLFLFVLSPLAGMLSDRIGSRMLCTLGMAILVVSFFLLAGVQPSNSLWPIVWRLSLTGLGVSMFTAPNNATVMTAVPKPFMGVAAGMVATVRNLGMVLGIAMAGSIFNTVFFKLSGGLDLKAYHPGLASVFMTAFGLAMKAGSAIALLGVAVSFIRGTDTK